MTKDPAVLFYTSDFLSGTSFMSMEQRGQYITLLCQQHQLGEIPENHMINICNSLDSPVIKKFLRTEQGNYYNERMRIEAEKRKTFCLSRSNNKSGRKKKEEKEIICKSYGNHKIIHMENDNDNDSVNVFNETLNNFKVMRKQLKKPLTEHGETLLLKELEKLAKTEEEKIAILNQSILNSWQGVFPLKVNITQNKPTTLQELRALVKADKTDHWTKDDWRHYNEMNTQAIRSGV